jgi:peroxiredoxin
MDRAVHSHPKEAQVATTNPLPSLQSQLDAISANIPDAIGARIAAGAGEVAASGVASGLEVGVRAPGFSLPDALGNTVTLDHLLSEGPVVVTFYRGEWCPYCNLQLRALQAALPEFRELGASLVAISPQTPDHSLSLTEKHELAFPVLSDATQEVIRAYHVQFTLAGDLEDLQVNVWHNDPREQNANHTRALPVPSTFVIDRDGIIRAAFASADWRVRVEPTEITTALRALHMTPAR